MKPLYRYNWKTGEWENCNDFGTINRPSFYRGKTVYKCDPIWGPPMKVDTKQAFGELH